MRNVVKEGIDYLWHSQLSGYTLFPEIRRTRDDNSLTLSDTNGNILPCRIVIDSPATQSCLTESSYIDIHGWCLYGGHIDKIEIYFDDQLLGKATYGLPRLDVEAAFPSYNEQFAGYKLCANINQMRHTPSK